MKFPWFKLPTTNYQLLSSGALALFIYMPFHIFLSQWLSTYTGGLDAWKVGKDVFAAVLTFLCVITVVIAKKPTKLFWWLLGIAALYTVLHLLLMITTDQPRDTGLLATVYNTRLMWFVLIGYSLTILNSHFSISISRQLIKLLILLSTIVCFIGLLQWVLPKDIMTHFGYSIERGVRPTFFIDDKPDLPRVFSTLRDPNSLGAFLILPIVILVQALIKGWKTNRRMLLVGLVTLHGLILFLTFSRGAWAATFVALLSLFLISYHRQLMNFLKRYAGPVAAICAVLVFGVFMLRDNYVVQNVVFHQDENTKLTGSNELHAIQVQKGLDGIADKPLGHGPGTAGLVSVHNADGGLITENYFVQIGYETGVAGLMIFLGFLFVLAKGLWRRRTNLHVQALIAGLTGLILMNMLFHTWANEAVAISWFLIAGWCLGYSKKL